MATDEPKSIIHRKTMGGRDKFDARVMTPAKALRLALAKIAAKMYGMAITVTMVQQVKLANKDIQAEAGNAALLILLDGAVGARGAALVDTQFLTALIEMQTTGQVRKAEAEARQVTRTDAAIVAPLLDAVLARYDEQLSDGNPDRGRDGFRFGDMMEDARSLALALEAPEFDLYRLTLDLEDGAKTGLLSLILPHRAPAPSADTTGKARTTAPKATLEKNALESQVALDAVLANLKIPLKDVCALEPGMILPLERECLKKTKLLAADGKVIAKVRMGQMNGMRAVLFLSNEEEDAAPGSSPAGDMTGQTAADTGASPSATTAPVPPARDDVVEGVANPVQAAGDPPLSAVEKTATAAARSAPQDTAQDTSAAPASEDEDELSPEDLLKAAQSLTESVRDTHEDA